MTQWNDSASADSTGKVSVLFQPNNAAVKWVAKQIGVENRGHNGNAPSGSTTVSLYYNQIMLAPSAFLTPTPYGIGTAAAGLPYTDVTPSDQLSIQIQGANANDEIFFTVYYDEVPYNKDTTGIV